MYYLSVDHLATRRKTYHVVIDEAGRVCWRASSVLDALLWIFDRGQRTVPIERDGIEYTMHLISKTDLQETSPWLNSQALFSPSALRGSSAKQWSLAHGGASVTPADG